MNTRWVVAWIFVSGLVLSMIFCILIAMQKGFDDEARAYFSDISYLYSVPLGIALGSLLQQRNPLPEMKGQQALIVIFFGNYSPAAAR